MHQTLYKTTDSESWQNKFDLFYNFSDIAPHPEDPPNVVEEVKLRAKNPIEYQKLQEEKAKSKRHYNYQLKYTKEIVLINGNYEVIGHKPQKLIEYLKHQNIEELIENELLIELR